MRFDSGSIAVGCRMALKRCRHLFSLAFRSDHPFSDRLELCTFTTRVSFLTPRWKLNPSWLAILGEKALLQLDRAERSYEVQDRSPGV